MRRLEVIGAGIGSLISAAVLAKSGWDVTVLEAHADPGWGWGGGFPQTHPLRSCRPRNTPGIWLVGDSIFPGQSTAGAALGGLHIARSIQNTFNKGFFHSKRPKVNEPLRCDTNPLG